MGSNRKLPFGYQMEMGRIVICPEEAKEVRLIFAKYDQGDSLKALADEMQNHGIAYDRDKRWNKNMIARILEDARYTGKQGFPQIITAVRFASIQEKRSARAFPSQRTEVQKILRQKLQQKCTREVEEQVLLLLNKVILYPTIIQVPAQSQIVNSQTPDMETGLKNVLSELPVDMDAAKKLIFELAALRYQTIGPEDYETEKLKRIFRQQKPMRELDADLIRRTVSTIQIDSNGSVKLVLKNKQII